MGSSTVVNGRLIPAEQQILLFSAEDWEVFVHEWLTFHSGHYSKIARFSGAGDLGIDVAGLVDKNGLDGVWDNFQCKHYAAALQL